jgi:PAS domain S-box-containing protein
MRWLHAISLIIVTSCIASAIVSIRSSVIAGEPSAKLINVAGRQRMLSQRIALQSAMAAQASLAHERLEAARALGELRHVTEQFVDGYKWLEAHEVFESPHEEALRLSGELAAVAERHRLDTPLQAKAAAAVNETMEQFLPGMEHAVHGVEARADAIIFQAKRQATLAGSGALLVLALQAFFVFRPIRRTVEQSLQATRAAAEASEHRARIEAEARRSVEVARQSLQHAVTRYERAEAEAAEESKSRQEAETRYDLAVAGTNDGIWDWDLLTNQLWYSPGFNKQLGYEDDPLEPSLDSWAKICHPDDQDRVWAAVDAHMKEGTPYDEMVRLQHRDGSWRHIRSRGSVARNKDGMAIRFAGAHVDMTDIIEAERRDRQNQQLLSAVLESMPGMLYWKDAEGRYLGGSRLFLEALELNSNAELIGRKDSGTMLEPFLEDDRQTVQAKGRPLSSERRIEIKGEPRSWISTRRGLLDEESQVIGTIGVYEDVTDRRLAELDMIDQNQRLFHATSILELRSKELRQAVATADHARRDAEVSRHAADEANDAKSRFLADVSHEIRTPMAVILGHADTIRRSQSQTATHASLQAIERNGQHLLTLLNEILDNAKAEAGELAVRLAPADPDAVLQDVATAMRGAAEAKSLSFHLKIDGKLPDCVETDAMRVRQVLYNLSGNAIKFTEKGSVTLAASWSDDRLRISVSDTGAGISPDQQVRLFQRFDQLDTGNGETFQRHGGSGLGLEISQRLCDLLGGTIEVQSIVNEGTTFSVEVPAPRIEVEAATEPVRAKDVPAALGKKVLLVEDHPELAKLASATLEAGGCTCQVAASGEEAVEMYQLVAATDDPFDVIVTDMNLGLMSGSDVVEIIRRLDPHKRVRVILHSANADQIGEADRKKLGFDAYLQKPVAAGELLRAVSGPLSAALDQEDDDEDFRQLCADYALQFSKAVEALEASPADVLRIRKIAHDLKPASAFGFAEISPAAAALEQAADASLAEETELPPMPIHALLQALMRAA